VGNQILNTAALRVNESSFLQPPAGAKAKKEAVVKALGTDMAGNMQAQMWEIGA